MRLPRPSAKSKPPAPATLQRKLSPSEVTPELARSSSPVNFFLRMMLTVPAIASVPYTGAPPIETRSTRSIRMTGMVLRSTEPGTPEAEAERLRTEAESQLALGELSVARALAGLERFTSAERR